MVVDNLWTGADQHWLGGFTKYWNEDPYTEGSYSYTGLGQAGLTKMFSAAAFL